MRTASGRRANRRSEALAQKEVHRDQVAALESRIESKAIQLDRSDWGEDFATPRYINALSGQLKSIYREANADTRQCEWDPHELGDDIRAALDIIDLSTWEGDHA